MEKRNVTISGNVTELQEFVTYEITQLRMEPDYIRSKIYTLYTYTARGRIHWIMHPRFPEALEIYRSHQDKSRGPLLFPSGLWVKTHGLRKCLRRLEGFLDTLLVYVSPLFSSLIHSYGCIRKYRAIRIGCIRKYISMGQLELAVLKTIISLKMMRPCMILLKLFIHCLRNFASADRAPSRMTSIGHSLLL